MDRNSPLHLHRRHRRNVALGRRHLRRRGKSFGTASRGGDPSCLCGTIFKLAPSGGGWAFTVLHTFIGRKDGAYPSASLVLDTSGYLDGTTVNGGDKGCGIAGCGTTFSFPSSGGSGSITPFNETNGWQPHASMTGTFTTTAFGGKTDSTGNVVEIKFAGRVKQIHFFDRAKPLGYSPLGTLLEVQGSLFGTTSVGGVGGQGAVFELILNPSTGHYKPVALHGFSGTDGAGSASGLVLDAAGNLYGTTTSGGADPGFDGVVFKLTPGPKNIWPETVLHSFSGGADGGAPYGTLVSDSAGNLYGTGIHGGAHGHGVVFEVIP